LPISSPSIITDGDAWRLPVIRRKGRLALKEEAIILKGLVSKVQRPKFSHFETFRLRPDAGEFGHTSTRCIFGSLWPTFPGVSALLRMLTSLPR
jgi:hypothetical protein